MSGLPKRQRVAAYAVILREGRILLSRLSSSISTEEMWTLPGGGLDHGEDPREAVVREVYEETGLHAEVGETARVYSAYMPGASFPERLSTSASTGIVRVSESTEYAGRATTPENVCPGNAGTVNCTRLPTRMLCV